MSLRTMALVSEEPETRARSVAFSPSSKETAAREELSTMPGCNPRSSASDSYSRIMRRRARPVTTSTPVSRGAWRIRDERVVGIEGHALFQFPPQHGDGFLRRAWELLKV